MLLERESPKGKPVSLFVTCIVDMVYPDTGMAAVDIMEHLGVEVDFPTAQTCCAQPAFNSGYRADARLVAQQYLRAFQNAEVIVTPSGSCAGMVRHEYPALFEKGSGWWTLAQQVASRTWELTEYLVDGLGVTEMGLSMPQPTTVALHDACHGMRLLGLGNQARALVSAMHNVTVTDLADHDVCCGFGGLFSVKMAAVSNAMLENKVDNINASDAPIILTGDVSCMTQMNGGLSRQKSTKRVRHIAEFLAAGLPKPVNP